MNNDAREAFITAIKKIVCKEMGKTNSALFSYQVFPLAQDICRIMGYEEDMFLRECGWSVDPNDGTVI